MSLPGDRIPPANLPAGRTSTPAETARMPAVYCRHGVRWQWVPDVGGYLCDDPAHFDGPQATTVGAIHAGCQPTYAHPPNAAQRHALDTQDVLRETVETVEQARYLADP